jgi:hypothetical protein
VKMEACTTKIRRHHVRRMLHGASFVNCDWPPILGFQTAMLGCEVRVSTQVEGERGGMVRSVTSRAVKKSVKYVSKSL